MIDLQYKRFLNKKDFEYYGYIVEHKKNVMIAYNLLIRDEFHAMSNNSSITKIEEWELDILKNRVIAHDLSKFSHMEFWRYRKSLFPTDLEEHEAAHHGISTKEYYGLDFQKAWLNHYLNNEHHPEHWKDKAHMAKIDMLEMCLDWSAMSIKFKDCPLKYFYNKKDKLIEEFGNEMIDYDYIENVLKSLSQSVKLYLEKGNFDIFKY